MTRFLRLAFAGPLLLAIGCSESKPAGKAPAVSPTKGTSGAPGTAPSVEPTTPAKPAEPEAASRSQTEPAAPGAPAKGAAAPSKDQPDKAAPSAPAKTQPAPGSVQDLLAQAGKALQAGNFADAIPLLEKVLDQDAKNRTALSALMQATQNQGIALAQGGNEKDAYPLFLKSASYLRRLLETPGGLNPSDRSAQPVILYNEACAYCKADELDKAVKSIEEAIQAGFNDVRQIDKDPDMDPIRQRDDFKKLRDGLEAKKGGDGGTKL